MAIAEVELCEVRIRVIQLQVVRNCRNVQVQNSDRLGVVRIEFRFADGPAAVPVALPAMPLQMPLQVPVAGLRGR